MDSNNDSKIKPKKNTIKFKKQSTISLNQLLTSNNEIDTEVSQTNINIEPTIQPIIQPIIQSTTETTIQEFKCELCINTFDTNINLEAHIKQSHKKHTFIEVCAGAGGLSLGLIKAGFVPILLNDNNKDCCKTLEHNHKDLIDNNRLKVVCDSLTKLDLKPYSGGIDLLTGGVPCFIAGTKVLTNNSYKLIEDLTVEYIKNNNILLMTHTGNFQPIVNIQQKQYNGNLYKFKVKYHPEIITCTDEHPFYIRKKNVSYKNKKKVYTFEEPVWKKANEITKLDYFGMVINNKSIIPEFTFNKIINQTTNSDITIKLDTKEQWFTLGYFIGDGWIEETKKKDGRLQYNIRFAINNKDEESVVEIISKVLPIVDKKCNTGKCKKFGCANFIWFNIFKMFGKYAHGKKIPEWVQDAPKELIQEFINGYIKADGNITKDGTHQITTVSPDLALGTQRLYLKLGYIFSINKYIRPKTCIIEGRTVNQRDTFQIRGKLTKSRYTTFIEGDYAWFPLANINIEISSNIPVYNFEVKNDNSYIIENIITHNCQSYSQAGSRKGLDDPRGNLMLKFADLIEVVKPRIFMIENVKGLLSHDEGKSLEKIIKTLNKNNLYNIVYKVLNAMNYGVPQKRERVFIIGTLKSENITYEYPAPDKRIITVGEALRGVPSSEGAVYSDKKKEYFAQIPQGGCWVNLPVDKQKEYLMSSFESGGGKRGILHRLSNAKPSLTLLCTPSQKQTERCHPTELRPLQVREYARIQSFDDTHQFIGSLSSKYKQIGNAVPVELARRVGISLIKALYKPS